MASLFVKITLLSAFSIFNEETNAQITTFSAELFTTTDVPCGCNICPAATSRVQWFSSSNPDVYENNGSAVAWWAITPTQDNTGSKEGFGINADFSMKICNVTLQQNKQLFRCLVIPTVGSVHCTHDVKLDIYARPEEPPAIDYVRQPCHSSGFHVTCSISHVFPMTFPILGSGGGNGTSDPNSDGTFDTKVAKYFSTAEVNTTIECVYSMRNFKGKSSLRVVDYGDISWRDGEEDCMDKNGTGSNSRCRRPRLWFLWTILMMGVIFKNPIL